MSEMQDWTYHYKEAERILRYIDNQVHPDYGNREERLAEAQVHATLATIRATPAPIPIDIPGE